MWLWLIVISAVLLGFYDVAKKQALKHNDVLWILVCATALTTLFLSPFLKAGPASDHLRLLLKAVLVSLSWVSGLIAMKTLPLTTVSTIKASRPMFVVLFSILLFGERLSLLQWVGVLLVLAALYLLSVSSRKEGIHFTRSKGIAWMVLSVITAFLLWIVIASTEAGGVIFAEPWEVFGKLVSKLQDGTLWPHIYISLFRVIVGFLCVMKRCANWPRKSSPMPRSVWKNWSRN